LKIPSITPIIMQVQRENRDGRAVSTNSPFGSSSSTVSSRRVDAILAQELEKLSCQDRSRIEEEIHGVQSLALEETPEMMEDALARFRLEVDCLPSFQKMAYQDAMVMGSNYVQDREFHRKFLRVALFDPKKAASMFCLYLDMLLSNFGPQALERPLRYDDLKKEEQDGFRTGPFQVLPSRDRAGRLVCIHMGMMTERPLLTRVS
jgi:hypothetical protein